jgi:flagellin-like hook-associated protein FlgL
MYGAIKKSTDTLHKSIRKLSIGLCVNSAADDAAGLAVQAAKDTLTQQDRGYIQLEIDQLKEEINRISKTTQFNRKKTA